MHRYKAHLTVCFLWYLANYYTDWLQLTPCIYTVWFIRRPQTEFHCHECLVGDQTRSLSPGQWLAQLWLKTGQSEQSEVNIHYETPLSTTYAPWFSSEVNSVKSRRVEEWAGVGRFGISGLAQYTLVKEGQEGDKGQCASSGLVSKGIPWTNTLFMWGKKCPIAVFSLSAPV